MKIFRKTTQIFAATAVTVAVMTASSSVVHAQMTNSCFDSCASLAMSVRQQVISSIMAQANSKCYPYGQYSGAEAGCLSSMQSSANQAGDAAASSAMANCSNQCSSGGGATCSINSMAPPAFANVRPSFQRAGV